MARLPDPSFLLIIQLHHLQAMLSLGLVPNPQTGQPNLPDPERARHELALLEILRRKTAGNLEDNEERILAESIAAIEKAVSGA